ncbi:MAG: hypothetical protein J0H98_07250 [Solirubrobacterales bacterium]|nr:hypothetical protein [Solirubrobacterales bacterium]
MTVVAGNTATPTVKVRLGNGRLLEEPLNPERQAKLWGLVVHGDQLGMIEAIRAERPDGGKKLKFPHRDKEGGDIWLPADSPESLAKFVTNFRDDYELFATPATFAEMNPGNSGVTGSLVVWIDQDEPEKIDLLREFEHRPHMVVATGGSGGVHAFWRLSYAVGRDELGVMNRKLVARLEGDRASHNPARILRVPGSLNHKANCGENADGVCRIIYADLQQATYDPEELVKGLRDYKQPARPRRRRQFPTGQFNTAGESGWIEETVEVAEGSSPTEYLYRLTGEAVSARGGHIRCPFHDHEDRHPSTYVYGDVGSGWFCFSCHRGGGPFQLAAALHGWTGGELTGDEFKRAAAVVAAAYGIDRKD